MSALGGVLVGLSLSVAAMLTCFYLAFGLADPRLPGIRTRGRALIGLALAASTAIVGAFLAVVSISIPTRPRPPYQPPTSTSARPYRASPQVSNRRAFERSVVGQGRKRCEPLA